MGQADRRSFIVLGCLLTVVTAAVLTSVSTPAPHTGGDNAGYLSLAHSLASGEGYTELWDPALPAHTKYPPMFPLILSTLMIAGASSWMAYKLLMAGLMSIGVLLVFVWASERTGPLSAAAVAIVTLFAAGWLQASRWVLSEPAFLVLTFLSLWAVARSTAGDPRAGGRLSPRGWLVLAGAGDRPGTDLFGILPQEQRCRGGDVSQLQQCPESYRSGPEARPVIDGARIPRVGMGERLPQLPPEPSP